jgi:hypothetical protein
MVVSLITQFYANSTPTMAFFYVFLAHILPNRMEKLSASYEL